MDDAPLTVVVYFAFKQGWGRAFWRRDGAIGDGLALGQAPPGGRRNVLAVGYGRRASGQYCGRSARRFTCGRRALRQFQGRRLFSYSCAQQIHWRQQHRHGQAKPFVDVPNMVEFVGIGKVAAGPSEQKIAG